ncbi:MAG: hypothetical protein WC496_04775 [Phycisphaerae bacterium]
MKNRLVILTFVLLSILACGVQATTVKQNFNADPFSNGWSKAESTYNVFTYNTTNNVSGTPGYLDCSVQRSNTVLGTAYIPLGQTYYMPGSQSGTPTVTDMWMGFDLMFANGTFTTQQACIGLINGDATLTNTATQNSLGLDICRTAGALRIRQETDNAAGAFAGTSVGTTMATLDDGLTHRYQVHYYLAGDGKVYADIKLGTFDVGTGAFTSSIFSQNGILLYDSAANWDLYGIDALGIKSLSMATSGTRTVKFVIDNMYFSTDGEQYMAVPSWVVPEPATITMLIIGGLLLRRKNS